MRREALRFVAELEKMPEAMKLAAADKLEKWDKLARKALKLEEDKPRSAINLRLLAEGNVARVRIASDEPVAEPPALVENTGLKPTDQPAPDAEAA